MLRSDSEPSNRPPMSPDQRVLEPDSTRPMHPFKYSVRIFGVYISSFVPDHEP